MSVPPPERAIEAPAAPPSPAPIARPLSPWITGACAAVLALFIALLVLVRASSPLDRLDRPADTLERLTARQLDLREALARSARVEQAAASALGAFDATLDEPIQAYEELLTADVPAPAEAELHLVILLGEAGRGGEARSRAAASAVAGGDGVLYAAWAGAAYGHLVLSPGSGAQIVSEIRGRLARSWFSDTLVARIAARIGDVPARESAEASIVARGRALLWRWRALTAGQLVVVVAGLAALRRLARRRAPAASAALPPPWPPADGYGLVARGAVAFLLVGWLPAALLPGHPELSSVATLAAGAPAIAWTWRYLSVRGVSPWRAFGLVVDRRAVGTVAAAALALIAVGTLGEALIGLAIDALGWHSHWADGLPEDLLWEPWWQVGLDTLDTAVWTPMVEEFMFRGVLYGSLRGQFGVAPAALVSGLIFAVAHGYGAAGFASVLWSGIIWAVAYERSRSLWAGIAAHAANNLIVNVTLLGLLRS